MDLSTRLLLAAAMFVVVPAAAFAQDATLSREVSANRPASVEGSETPNAASSARDVAGPSLAAATVGVRAHTATEDLTAQQLAQRATHHAGLGVDGALMIVGAAAFIAGLIIGGGAGTAIAIAGAAIGLYGLYLYLQ